jgi:hypothetical protein
MLLQLQRTAGNAAVSRLIARLAIQRQDDDGSDSDPGSQGGCAGAIGIVDELSDENAADDQSSTSVQTQIVGQPITVQRQGGGGQAGGGSCPNPQWSDYTTVPENYSTFAAQSYFEYRPVNNRYVVTMNRSGQWAKQSIKTGSLSAQILRHEWYHFRLACVLAGKANAALEGGANPRIITHQVGTTSQRQTDSYDADTNHGLNTNMQTQWENDIDNNVPDFPVP